MDDVLNNILPEPQVGERRLIASLIGSGLILGWYILLETYLDNKSLYWNMIFGPFKLGLFIVGGIVYFITLLVLSSRYYKSFNANFYQLLIWISTLIALCIGSYSENLSIFRGMSLIYFVIYVL